MDYLDNAKTAQKAFGENPRAEIEKRMEINKNSAKRLIGTGIFRNRIERVIDCQQFLGEYANLIKHVWNETGVPPARAFKDDIIYTSILQRFDEHAEILNHNYQNNVDAISALRLGRAYAWSIETIWSRLKILVYLAGLNPKLKHLTIGQLEKHIKTLESQYGISLVYIKSTLNPFIRNHIDHESFYFSPPNQIMFFKRFAGGARVVKQMSVLEVKELYEQNHIILAAFFIAEDCAMDNCLRSLLKLNDEELKEFASTGKLTLEMEQKMRS